MIYVAILELVLLAVVTMSFLSILSQNRSHGRREDFLLDKALHAAGRPWTLAPADEIGSPVDLEELLAPRAFTPSPEQEP